MTFCGNWDGDQKCKCLADLIYVHVALSAASGLEHDEGEVVDELSGNNLREDK